MAGGNIGMMMNNLQSQIPSASRYTPVQSNWQPTTPNYPQLPMSSGNHSAYMYASQLANQVQKTPAYDPSRYYQPSSPTVQSPVTATQNNEELPFWTRVQNGENFNTLQGK